jgi:hypothetical protein
MYLCVRHSHAARIRTYPVPPGFTFHHINAYEINPDGSEPAPLSGAPGRYLVLDTGTARCVWWGGWDAGGGLTGAGRPCCPASHTHTLLEASTLRHVPVINVMLQCRCECHVAWC